MEIRRLGPDDVATLKQIRVEALRSDPDAFGSTLAREEARSDDDWRAWLERGATFAALDARDPVGMAVGVPEDGSSLVGLYAMFVAARARRAGVGRGLIDRVCDYATGQGAHGVVLWVVDGNRSATALYESCGFVATGGTERRERDGRLEHEMVRAFSRSAP